MLLSLRNRFLSNPRELLNVKGWKDSLSDSAFQVVFAEVSPHVADQLNFNTMTERRIKWLGYKFLCVRQNNRFSQNRVFRLEKGP